MNRAEESADTSVRSRLAAGSQRGLGAAGEIVAEALHLANDAALIAEVVDALGDVRPIVQNRAARTLKKIQAERPQSLQPFAKRLLRAALACPDLRARWNLLIVCGNLALRGADRALAIDLMFDRLRTGSALEHTFAMQALVNFADQDPRLLQRVKPIVQAALENPSAAVQARARRLLPLVKA